jgi:hypothetical protein
MLTDDLTAAVRALVAERDALRARAAALEAFLGGNVCSAHPERTHGCLACDPAASAAHWYGRSAALEAGLRELAACWEGCVDPACCAGGGLCGRCLTREHAAREAARRLLGDAPP